MPGPAIHHLIAEELLLKIRNQTGLGNEVDYNQVQTLLSDPKNLPYYYLGCQGPDFLFFNIKDMNATAGTLASYYFKAGETIHDIKKRMKDLIPEAIFDALELLQETEAKIVENSVLGSNVKDTIEKAKTAIQAIMTMITEAGKDYLTDFNVFEIFNHPYRDGEKDAWWWFDALHYRKTGAYVQSLLDTAPKDSPLYLYAIGYLTHYAGDIVGHPFVNLNSGGPYRSHAQRHKTAEGYHDVLIYDKIKGVDFNHSALHWLYNFNYNGEEIKPIEEFEFEHHHPALHTSILNDTVNLNLAKFIADNINRVYQEHGDATSPTEYGQRLSPEDVDNAYKVYYSWFKSTTDSGTLPTPRPYSFGETVNNANDIFINNMNNIADLMTPDTSGSFSLSGFFKALIGAALGALLAALALLDYLAGMIYILAASEVRKLLSMIYEKIYDAFQKFRLAVSSNGLALPMKEHLSYYLLQQFKSPSIPDTNSSTAYDIFDTYPIQKITPQSVFDIIFNKEKHLVYPIIRLNNGLFEMDPEPLHTNPCPEYYSIHNADFYINGDITFSENLLEDIDKLIQDSDRDIKKDEEALKNIITPDLKTENTLGNALDLIEKTFKRHEDKNRIIDFNLDGDRGYAYPCWSQIVNGAPDSAHRPQPLNIPVNLSFIKNK